MAVIAFSILRPDDNKHGECHEIFEFDTDTDQERYYTEYEPIPKIKIMGEPETVLSFDEETFYYPDPIIVKNLSGKFIFLDNSQNFTISNFNGYVVELSLSYGFRGGPKFARGFDNYQIILLDNNYNPIYVFSEKRAWLS